MEGKMSVVKGLFWSSWDWKRGFSKAVGLHYSIVRQIYKWNASIQQRCNSPSTYMIRLLKPFAISFMLNPRYGLKVTVLCGIIGQFFVRTLLKNKCASKGSSQRRRRRNHSVKDSLKNHLFLTFSESEEPSLATKKHLWKKGSSDVKGSLWNIQTKRFFYVIVKHLHF